MDFISMRYTNRIGLLKRGRRMKDGIIRIVLKGIKSFIIENRFITTILLCLFIFMVIDLILVSSFMNLLIGI